MQPKNIDYSTLKMSIVSVALLTGLLLLGCDNQTKSSPPRPVPEVTVVTVQPQKVVLTNELPGRTSPCRVAEIRPQVSGLILKRLFREGSDVKAGELLYQIDPVPFEAVFENAQAALARAEANLTAIQLRAKRFEELLPDKAVSQQDYDDAISALKQAMAEVESWKAQVKTARINLEYTRITAPISGRIGRSRVTEGAIITAYQPIALATIQQLDPMYVDVPQSTTDLLRLKKLLKSGQLDQNGPSQKKVGLILDDGTTYPWKGTFQFRDVTVEPSTGTVVLRIVFPNSENILLPGMFVRALVKEGVDKQAILIPQEAVSRDPKGNPLALLVDSQSRVEQRQLTIDRAIGNQWLVTSGLDSGDKVIVEGALKVRPGATVKSVSTDETVTRNPAAGSTNQPAASAN
jgi:membrane fusion protein (multidrug efflux system)